MEQKKLDRINELARASRERALTSEEKAEQKQLRDEYIALVRQNLTGQLDRMVVVYPDGSRKKIAPKS